MLTGHDGFAHLYKFKLKDSPYCACDPAKLQGVLHVHEESHIFLWERETLEVVTDGQVDKRYFPETSGRADHVTDISGPHSGRADNR
ncbi:hypothetical protein EVAR_103552_1 [Eumeta japonica]|uniref:Uncharacterized protein n=1 Tax=Eumeta variegata TaxID=151549 RepID=A0A4C1YF88_EUMVA|nr:hypothetical protein EVAR_103552_1 [Eumeta japonica]